MAVPMIHAQSSAKNFGGKPEDYIDIHELMDSTKAAFPDNRHRAISHNSWFTTNIIPKIFGHMRINSDGNQYSTKDVAERHILEDFRMKFIPSIQDYLENMEMKQWMQNGLGTPSSATKLYKKRKEESEPVEKKPSLTELLDILLEKNGQKPVSNEQLDISNSVFDGRKSDDFIELIKNSESENTILDGNFGGNGGFENIVLDGSPSRFEEVVPEEIVQEKNKKNSIYKD